MLQRDLKGHAALLQAVQIFGTDWKRIAAHVGNERSKDSCRHRWHNKQVAVHPRLSPHPSVTVYAPILHRAERPAVATVFAASSPRMGRI